MTDKTRREFLGDSAKASLGIFGISKSSQTSTEAVERAFGIQAESEGFKIYGTVMPPERYTFKEETMVLFRSDWADGHVMFPISSIDESSYQEDLLESIREGEIISDVGSSKDAEEFWNKLQSDSFDYEEVKETSYDHNIKNYKTDSYSQSINSWMQKGGW